MHSAWRKTSRSRAVLVASAAIAARTGGGGMGDEHKAQEKPQQDAAQEDVELAEEEAEDVKGGGIRYKPEPQQLRHARGSSRYAWTGATSPRRSRQDLTCSISSSVASTRGGRRPPTSWPSRLSAALMAIGFVTTFRRS